MLKPIPILFYNPAQNDEVSTPYLRAEIGQARLLEGHFLVDFQCFFFYVAVAGGISSNLKYSIDILCV